MAIFLKLISMLKELKRYIRSTIELNLNELLLLQRLYNIIEFNGLTLTELLSHIGELWSPLCVNVIFVNIHFILPPNKILSHFL